MKILVLNGSPKKENSDTLHITRAFLDGMQEAAPQEIRLLHIIDHHIEFCSGCLACMRNGGVCRHKDDMSSILEEILESDLLLFSFPLYCYGMPAMLKNLIDRTLPLSAGISNPTIPLRRSCAVISQRRISSGIVWWHPVKNDSLPYFEQIP